MIGLGSFLILAIASASSLAKAEELTYSDKQCMRGVECRILMNDKPDYALVEAQVIEVIDGDSVEMRLFMLPGLEYVVNVRLKGVDTPEIRGFDCEPERVAGEAARAFLNNLLKPGTWVYLSAVEYDKYGGRLVADVSYRYSDRDKPVAQEVVDAGHAIPDDDQGPRHDWCVDEFGEPL